MNIQTKEVKMEKLAETVGRLVSRGLQPGSAGTSRKSNEVMKTHRSSTSMPRIICRETDVDIPRSVWSSWIPDGEPRQLRRALTPSERRDLELRRDELAPYVGPFDGREETKVALAIADMFGSFPSMRQSGEETSARLDAALRVLAEFPAWAIVKACGKIQVNGVWRDGKYDQQWPPSDAEIARVVREEFRLYGDSHRSAVALLTAEVEP